MSLLLFLLWALWVLCSSRSINNKSYLFSYSPPTRPNWKKSYVLLIRYDDYSSRRMYIILNLLSDKHHKHSRACHKRRKEAASHFKRHCSRVSRRRTCQLGFVACGWWKCDGIESSANRCEICLQTTSKWRRIQEETEMNGGTNRLAHVVNLYLCK